MKYFWLLLLLPALCFGATQSTVTPGLWQGYAGTKIVTRDHATEVACAHAVAAIGPGKYFCKTSSTVVVVSVAEPPVVPPVVVPPSGDTITHGQAFTITGSGFGTKPKAAPLVYDNFENGSGSLKGKAATVGAWGNCDWSTPVTYAAYEGGKVAKHAFGSGTYNASLCVDPSPATQTFYLDFWMKGVAKSNPSRNWKAWRTYGPAGDENGNTVYYCSGGGIDLGGWKWLPEAPPPKGWVHYQIVSTPGVTRHYRNGVLDSSGTGAKAVAEIRIGHYWGLDGVTECASNPGGDVFTDDVYVDTSVARVILGNASTFAASTNTAIQRPTAWANEAVTIIPNTRGFARGETAYLIVIDTGNVERAAKKVTVK